MMYMVICGWWWSTSHWCWRCFPRTAFRRQLPVVYPPRAGPCELISWSVLDHSIKKKLFEIKITKIKNFGPRGDRMSVSSKRNVELTKTQTTPIEQWSASRKGNEYWKYPNACMCATDAARDLICFYNKTYKDAGSKILDHYTPPPPSPNRQFEGKRETICWEE